MQLKRLWETISFFEVIPLFSCLQSLVKYNQTKLGRSSMNYILLSDGNNELAKEIINLMEEKKLLYSILPQDNLTPNILEGVEKIICFPQENIYQLINLVRENLQPSELILTSFHSQNIALKNIWGAVDDVVMGGISNSNLILQPTNALFTGRVSTDNNGGFVSVRSKNFTPPWDLSDYEGIRLRIKGDGQRYKFITRCEGKWDGISYCYSFDTITNIWMTIDIPFNQLIPVFRAKTVRDAGKFDNSNLYSLQLMLSKFEYDGVYNPTFRAGAFSLEIESIKAYGKKDSPQLIFMGNASFWNQYQNKNQLLTVYGETAEEIL